MSYNSQWYGFGCDFAVPVYVPARVEVLSVPLFYTMNWRVAIFVNDEEKWSSHEEPTKPTAEEVKAWVSMIISNNSSVFKMLNVDYRSLYRSVGGDPNEIEWI